MAEYDSKQDFHLAGESVDTRQEIAPASKDTLQKNARYLTETQLMRDRDKNTH